MTTGSTTGSAHGVRAQRSAGGSTANGQWWKAWVLLSSLGATVLGWVAFSTGEPSVESAVVAPALARIGHEWERSCADVLNERRASRTCVVALYVLKA